MPGSGTSDGREYLDGTAGLWFVNVGHGRSEIAQAAAAQMERLAAHHCFADHANEPALALAERLSGVAPVDDGVVFFTNDGSESVDSAGKIARRYWSLLGQPERQVIVSRRHAYHGMNAYGTSLAGIPANMEGFGALIEGRRPWRGTTRPTSSARSTSSTAASPRSSASR